MKPTFTALIVSTALLFSRRPAAGATMMLLPSAPEASTPPQGEWTEGDSLLFDDEPSDEARAATPGDRQDELLAKKKKKAKKKKSRRS